MRQGKKNLQKEEKHVKKDVTTHPKKRRFRMSGMLWTDVIVTLTTTRARYKSLGEWERVECRILFFSLSQLGSYVTTVGEQNFKLKTPRISKWLRSFASLQAHEHIKIVMTLSAFRRNFSLHYINYCHHNHGLSWKFDESLNTQAFLTSCLPQNIKMDTLTKWWCMLHVFVLREKMQRHTTMWKGVSSVLNKMYSTL